MERRVLFEVNNSLLLLAGDAFNASLGFCSTNFTEEYTPVDSSAIDISIHRRCLPTFDDQFKCISTVLRGAGLMVRP